MYIHVILYSGTRGYMYSKRSSSLILLLSSLCTFTVVVLVDHKTPRYSRFLIQYYQGATYIHVCVHKCKYYIYYLKKVKVLCCTTLEFQWVPLIHVQHQSMMQKIQPQSIVSLDVDHSTTDV